MTDILQKQRGPRRFRVWVRVDVGQFWTAPLTEWEGRTLVRYQHTVGLDADLVIDDRQRQRELAPLFAADLQANGQHCTSLVWTADGQSAQHAVELLHVPVVLLRHPAHAGVASQFLSDYQSPPEVVGGFPLLDDSPSSDS